MESNLVEGRFSMKGNRHIYLKRFHGLIFRLFSRRKQEPNQKLAEAERG